ncbi:class II aldolase/adducin family protein [Candidatus Woesearchaeota archaeon]|nr:class II aldolase/adducin family protein [Candidatus Woesearchaeota archaeon]
MKTLYIAGKFDDNNGRPSKIAAQIYEQVKTEEMQYINGGSFSDLEKILESVTDFKLIYWFADVDNEKPKLIKEIKEKNKECILVTSKRNNGEYSFADLIYRALDNKSNLFVEFSQLNDRYRGRVADPLGNVFLDYSKDFNLVGKALKKRTQELLNFSRVQSEQVNGEIKTPNETEFFTLVKNYATKFHELIHAHPEAVNRFFGNASFRCENGFPSFRKDKIIFVSKRNVDKREISALSFVPVKIELPVQYQGENKPSVDTPIQVKLYEHYNNVNYMLHAHVYVKDAPFTDNIVPCGALEEFDEVVKLFPNKTKTNFAVNLRGHGSLVLANNLAKLENIQYFPRMIPEIHGGYLE